jgi:hypothetical protein
MLGLSEAGFMRDKCEGQPFFVRYSKYSKTLEANCYAEYSKIRDGNVLFWAH